MNKKGFKRLFFEKCAATFLNFNSGHLIVGIILDIFLCHIISLVDILGHVWGVLILEKTAFETPFCLLNSPKAFRRYRALKIAKNYVLLIFSVSSLFKLLIAYNHLCYY